MKENEDRYVAVVERHALLASSTITLMKHKHIYVILVKVTRIDGAITVIIMVL